MQWELIESPVKKLFLAHLSVKKVMLTVVLGMNEPISLGFLEKGTIVNIASYYQLFWQIHPFLLLVYIHMSYSIKRIYIYNFQSTQNIDSFVLRLLVLVKLHNIDSWERGISHLIFSLWLVRSTLEYFHWSAVIFDLLVKKRITPSMIWKNERLCVFLKWWIWLTAWKCIWSKSHRLSGNHYNETRWNYPQRSYNIFPCILLSCDRRSLK